MDIFRRAGVFALVLASSIQLAAQRFPHLPEGKGTPSPLVDAVEDADIGALRVLLAQGIDPDRLHYENETALVVASRLGYVDMVRMLIDAGARVNQMSTIGWTALMWAGQKGRADVIRLLLANGADVRPAEQTWGNTALMFAARDGNLQSLDLLVDAGADLTVVNKQGRNAFLLAAEGGNVPNIKRLLALGARIDHVDKDGTTVLMIAAIDPPATQALLAAGADMNASGPFGMTPLHIAAQNGWADAARLLIDAGANIHARDHFGQTPLDRAIAGKRFAVIELLKAVGAVN